MKWKSNINIKISYSKRKVRDWIERILWFEVQVLSLYFSNYSYILKISWLFCVLTFDVNFRKCQIFHVRIKKNPLWKSICQFDDFAISNFPLISSFSIKSFIIYQNSFWKFAEKVKITFQIERAFYHSWYWLLKKSEAFFE